MRKAVIVLAMLIGGLLVVGCCNSKEAQLQEEKAQLQTKLEELKGALDNAKRLAAPAAEIPETVEAGGTPGCQTDLGVCRASLDKCEKDPFTGKKYFAGTPDGGVNPPQGAEPPAPR